MSEVLAMLAKMAEKIGDIISISAILKSVRSRKLADMGSDLSQLYGPINEVRIAKTQFVDKLEQARKMPQWPLERSDAALRLEIRNILEEQRAGLLAFLQSAERLAPEFQIVDSESYCQLVSLFKKMVDVTNSSIEHCYEIDWRHAVTEMRQARKELRTIKVVCTRLSGAIQKNFSLQDILLEIRKRRRR